MNYQRKERTVDVRGVIPMHFGDDTAVVDRLLADPVAADYRKRIVPLTKRGQVAEFSV